MILTINQLEDAAVYANPRRLELILPNLNFTLKKYDINTNLRIAHFLSQLLVESNFFKYTEDIETGQRYEGLISFGNVYQGDGRKFKGRGYFKLIGRSAYEAYKQASGLDVISYPYLVSTPRVAMDIAGWSWDTRRINFPADEDNLEEVTRSVSGGYLILREREEILKRVKKVIGLN